MTIHDYYNNEDKFVDPEPEIIGPPEKKLNVDTLREYTTSRIRTEQMIEYIENNFLIIPRSVDPLSYLHKQGIIKEVGSICAHGLGERPCPVMAEAQHQKISNIYAYNPPEFSDEPDKDKQIKPKQNIDEQILGVIPDHNN